METAHKALLEDRETRCVAAFFSGLASRPAGACPDALRRDAHARLSETKDETVAAVAALCAWGGKGSADFSRYHARVSKDPGGRAALVDALLLDPREAGARLDRAREALLSAAR